MGSSGIKRKRRQRLPKVSDGIDQRGTVPLGKDPAMGPYDARAQIVAAGAVARALKSGTPAQRRIAAVLFLLIAVPLVLAALATVFGR